MIETSPRERGIAESDWKLFRKFRELALQRFCERVLGEVERVSSEAGKTWHERYLQVYRLIRSRDLELANAFNNPRRSTALEQTMLLRSYDLLKDEEFSQFSDEIRNAVEKILAIRRS